ncbi:hypothetical protein Thiowin_04309 [Thiorhodovibrio winogradskyi]|uniref:Uncharacterized protein n=1 Tax=Thiorhodovibrio winogradskyi TaxID=77007 RepID=A0ABZ0SFV2_9GAMM
MPLTSTSWRASLLLTMGLLMAATLALGIMRERANRLEGEVCIQSATELDNRQPGILARGTRISLRFRARARALAPARPAQG